MRKNLRAATAVGFVVASFSASCCLQAIGQQLLEPTSWHSSGPQASKVPVKVTWAKPDFIPTALPGPRRDFSMREPAPDNFGASCGTIGPQQSYDPSVFEKARSDGGAWPENLEQFRGKVSQKTVDFLARLQERVQTGK